VYLLLALCLFVCLQVKSIDIDLDELQGTPEEVATKKCRLAVEKINAPVIIEDTCLCFEALGGSFDLNLIVTFLSLSQACRVRTSNGFLSQLDPKDCTKCWKDLLTNAHTHCAYLRIAEV
jgi:hypothetical protein